MFQVIQEDDIREVRLVFVVVGQEERVQVMSQLASFPPERNVVHVNDFDALLEAPHIVLHHVLASTQLVYRAKCKASLVPYEVVEDIDAEEGLEVVCPGWKVRREAFVAHWRWDPEKCA